MATSPKTASYPKWGQFRELNEKLKIAVTASRRVGAFACQPASVSWRSIRPAPEARLSLGRYEAVVSGNRICRSEYEIAPTVLLCRSCHGLATVHHIPHRTHFGMAEPLGRKMPSEIN